MFIDQLPDIRDVQFTFGRKARDQKAKNYVIYCRKSDEKDDRTSIPQQIKQCWDLAEREGLHVIGVISEQKSARHFGRPKFSNLIYAIKDGKPLMCLDVDKASKHRPDGIIAWKPDRLARNMRDAGEVIELLDAGLLLDLKFVMYSFHNDSSGKEHLAMEFARAKAYSDHLQDNVLRGLIGQEMRGRGTRPLPPAFTTVDNEDSEDYLKIIPSPLHHHWRNAYRWKLEGKTNDQIAALMVADGYESYYTRKKNKVKRTLKAKVDGDYVGRHLKKALHCGLYVAGEKSKEPRRADLNELYPLEFNGEPFPLVVSVEDFKKINPNLFSDTAKNGLKTKRRSNYPLAGKVVCSIRRTQNLPANLHGATPKGGSLLPSPRFTCDHCNPSHSVNLIELFKAVGEKLKEIKMTEREHKLFVVTAWVRYQSDVAQEQETRSHIAALKGNNTQEITRAREELNSMRHGTPRGTVEEIEVQKNKLKRLGEEQDDLLSREKKLNEDSLARYNELDAFLELSKNASQWWKKAGDEEKIRMGELLILNAVIEGNKVASVSLAEPFAGWAKRYKTNDGGVCLKKSEPISSRTPSFARSACVVARN